MTVLRRKPVQYLLWSAAAVAAIYVLGFFGFVSGLPTHPAKLDHPDGIVALTGGNTRLSTAVALFESGVGKRLLITGVHPTTTKDELRTIVHGGARFQCCADLGFAAANTFGNAAETAAWTKAHGYKSLVIVTASYHMPRSLAEFAAEMPAVKLEPWPVEPDGIDMKTWWQDPHTLKLLQSEYVKYLATLVLTHLVPEEERRALDHGVAGTDSSASAAKAHS